MRKQLTIIAAGLGLAVGGFGLFSVSASAMPASGVAAISEVNHVPDPIGLPVERVQYYPYGYPCVFPFCGYGYYGPGYYGGGYYGRGYYGGGYYGRGYGGRGYYGRGVAGRGHYGRGVGGHGGGGHVGRHR